MARFDEELARTRNVGLQERSQFLPEGIGRPTATGEAIARPEGVSDVLARPGFDPSGAIRPSAAAQEFLARKAPELERGTAKIRLREQQQANEARAAQVAQRGEQAELQHQRELEVAGAPAAARAQGDVAIAGITAGAEAEQAQLDRQFEVIKAGIASGDAEAARQGEADLVKLAGTNAIAEAAAKGEVPGTPQYALTVADSLKETIRKAEVEGVADVQKFTIQSALGLAAKVAVEASKLGGDVKQADKALKTVMDQVLPIIRSAIGGAGGGQGPSTEDRARVKLASGDADLNGDGQVSIKEQQVVSADAFLKRFEKASPELQNQLEAQKRQAEIILKQFDKQFTESITGQGTPTNGGNT